MTFRVAPPVLLGAILLVVAALIALGVWQLQRNQWKNDLVEEQNARTQLAPLLVPDALASDHDELDYRRITAEGRWDLERSFILANRARFQTRGEELVTPFLPSSEGPAILVSRGWYPLSQREAVLADLASQPDEPLEGLIRTELSGGQETAAGTWTAIDPERMGASLPYPVTGWIVIEGTAQPPGAGPGDSLPVQGYQPFASTTPHLEYALTWFGLAIALVIAALARFVFGPRRRQRANADGTTTTR